jgi:hypothetical protein
LQQVEDVDPECELRLSLACERQVEAVPQLVPGEHVAREQLGEPAGLLDRGARRQAGFGDRVVTRRMERDHLLDAEPLPLLHVEAQLVGDEPRPGDHARALRDRPALERHLRAGRLGDEDA